MDPIPIITKKRVVLQKKEKKKPGNLNKVEEKKKEDRKDLTKEKIKEKKGIEMKNVTVNVGVSLSSFR